MCKMPGNFAVNISAEAVNKSQEIMRIVFLAHMEMPNWEGLALGLGVDLQIRLDNNLIIQLFSYRHTRNTPAS